MEINIIGTGGVGGYFGGRLLDSGANVRFFARGKNFESLKQNGLKILSAKGNLQLKNIQVYDTNDVNFPSADIILIAVKLWATDDAALLAKKMLKNDSAVISLQNGVVAIETLKKVIPESNIAGGVSAIAALIEEPGVIRHNGDMASLQFGEVNNEQSERLEKFYNICSGANFQSTIPPNIKLAIWEKFVLLCTMSAITTISRLPIGPLREDPDSRNLIQQIMQEVVDIGTKKNIEFEKNIVENKMKLIDNLPEQMVASMCGDYRRGLKLELPWLSGYVFTEGKKLGISTPANNFIYSVLKHHSNGEHPLIQN